MGKITAPFTAEQVDGLNRWQHRGDVHEFTCGHDHPEPRRLVATPQGWICPWADCDYKQHWAHAFMVIVVA